MSFLKKNFLGTIFRQEETAYFPKEAILPFSRAQMTLFLKNEIVAVHTFFFTLPMQNRKAWNTCSLGSMRPATVAGAWYGSKAEDPTLPKCDKLPIDDYVANVLPTVPEKEREGTVDQAFWTGLRQQTTLAKDTLEPQQKQLADAYNALVMEKRRLDSTAAEVRARHEANDALEDVLGKKNILQKA